MADIMSRLNNEMFILSDTALPGHSFNMKKPQQFTVIIEWEDRGYVSLCPELDIASQGETVSQAKANLIEALELFFEAANRSEVMRRLKN